MAFLLNDYIDLKELARGGMGKVYLATQVSLNRKVVIKEMTSGMLADPLEIRRFENEARAAGAIAHDNIIRIYDYGEDRGSFYIAMEYIDGSSLDQILKSNFYLPEIGLMITLQALKGLDFAHQQGIIHRDVKPGNILVSKVGAVKVVDFGLAHANSEQLHLTTKDMIMGTPIFMSPEQATGEEKKDQRMDVWSAGVLLYRIITGSYPFAGENVPALLVNIIQQTQPPVQDLVPALPVDLATIINHCLEKDRERRLQNLEPLIESLQNYFYEMGIKDTSAWIQRYENDPEATVRSLALVLLEYHIRKEAQYRTVKNEPMAQMHLEEASRYESQDLPLNKVRETIKLRDTSAIFKKSPHRGGTLIKKTSGKWKHVKPPAKKGIYIGFAAVCIGAAAMGLALFDNKANQRESRAAVETRVQLPQAAPAATVIPDTALSNSASEAKVESRLPIKPSKKNLPPTGKKVPGGLAKTVDSATGVIKATVSPSLAEVSINGVKASQKELSEGKQLKPGSHIIIAALDGYETFSKTINLSANEVQAVSANLVPRAREPGGLHIYSSPWAEVFINGSFSGNAPTSKPIALPDGPHSVVLRRDGFKTYEETVMMINGELKKMKVKLEPDNEK